MVYVHAKGMIVDDEYVMLGSANINQRSMAGSRDTEIAIGAYQNHYTWAKKGKHPRGEVGIVSALMFNRVANIYIRDRGSYTDHMQFKCKPVHMLADKRITISCDNLMWMQMFGKM